jgi:hypothetical protein
MILSLTLACGGQQKKKPNPKQGADATGFEGAYNTPTAPTNEPEQKDTSWDDNTNDNNEKSPWLLLFESFLPTLKESLEGLLNQLIKGIGERSQASKKLHLTGPTGPVMPTSGSGGNVNSTLIRAESAPHYGQGSNGTLRGVQAPNQTIPMQRP